MNTHPQRNLEGMGMSSEMSDVAMQFEEIYNKPSGYSGIYSFHKYWGKKPSEPLRFLVQQFSEKGDVIVDPFLGFGSLARESISEHRRFIGVDINPIAAAIGRFIAFPPNFRALQNAINRVSAECRSSIENTYITTNDQVASHFLWSNEGLQSVWVSKPGKKRIEAEPSAMDECRANCFVDYKFETCKPLTLYDNSRINSTDKLSWEHLFTGRALRNIDVIITSIKAQEHTVQLPLMLILSSSIGQMSKMVFSISRRGKRSGIESNRVEVGSWVIGFWRPAVHFEVNVWNCFNRRAQKTLTIVKSLQEAQMQGQLGAPRDVITGKAIASIECMDASGFAKTQMPESSVPFILTDPPHGDRIPYLELSEIWNALLGFNVNWRDEIVISNAKGRCKDKKQYTCDLVDALAHNGRLLTKNGVMGLIFNTRDRDLLLKILDGMQAADLRFWGSLPMHYSAQSVVQDNRRGSLSHDHLLFFSRNHRRFHNEALAQMSKLDSWISAPIR